MRNQWVNLWHHFEVHLKCSPVGYAPYKPTNFVMYYIASVYLLSNAWWSITMSLHSWMIKGILTGRWRYHSAYTYTITHRHLHTTILPPYNTHCSIHAANLMQRQLPPPYWSIYLSVCMIILHNGSPNNRSTLCAQSQPNIVLVCWCAMTAVKVKESDWVIKKVKVGDQTSSVTFRAGRFQLF